MTLLTTAINIDKSVAASERGFTLVEAMISMLVTVVGLVSLAGMFTVAMKTNASSRSFTTATTFAQDKLEQLGAISFQRLVDRVARCPHGSRPCPRGRPHTRGVLALRTRAADAYGETPFHC